MSVDSTCECSSPVSLIVAVAAEAKQQRYPRIHILHLTFLSVALALPFLSVALALPRNENHCDSAQYSGAGVEGGGDLCDLEMFVSLICELRRGSLVTEARYAVSTLSSFPPSLPCLRFGFANRVWRGARGMWRASASPRARGRSRPRPC